MPLQLVRVSRNTWVSFPLYGSIVLPKGCRETVGLHALPDGDAAAPVMASPPTRPMPRTAAALILTAGLAILAINTLRIGALLSWGPPGGGNRFFREVLA